MAFWQEGLVMAFAGALVVAFLKILGHIARHESSPGAFWVKALATFVGVVVVGIALFFGFVRSVRMCPETDGFLERNGIAAPPNDLGEFRIIEEDFGLIGVRCTAMVGEKVVATDAHEYAVGPLRKVADLIFLASLLSSFMFFHYWTSRAYWGGHVYDDPHLYWSAVADSLHQARWPAHRAAIVEPWTW